MKTTNSLEEQMRSWALRRPSARLERQLFGAPDAERKAQGRERVLALPWYQTLGASLAGCAVVLFTILNLTTDATQHSAQPFPTFSNHLASLVVASAPLNTWRAPILDWTNERTTGSSMRSFDLLNTNRILP